MDCLCLFLKKVKNYKTSTEDYEKERGREELMKGERKTKH